MQSPMHLLTGLIWLCIGIALFYARDRIFKAILESDTSVMGRAGMPVRGGRFYRLFSSVVVVILSLGCLLAAVSDLYQGITGREAWLRTAGWGSLWPF